MSVKQGQILEVSVTTLGDELESDHLIGATVLQLGDVSPYSDKGGTVIIGEKIDGEIVGDIYEYDEVDRENLTITVPSGLAAAASVDTMVYVYPLAEEKWAKVETQQDEEPMEARVSHALFDKIPDGVRDDVDQELVLVQLEKGDWVVTQIIAELPEIDGTLVAVREGAIPVYDAAGVLRTVIGIQADGTYTVIDVNGPPPPQPVAPTVDVQPGLLVVSSYGLTVTGEPWPADFRRIDVHVSSTPGFTPEVNTRVNEFSIEGGAVSLALDPGTYYTKLVAVSTSGAKSVASTEVSGVVPPPLQGEQGVPGPPGEDGQTLYTWVKYADTPTTGMSDSPTGKAYLGLAYNKADPTESSTYSDYSWSLIEGPQGEQGVPGTPGADGTPRYTWVKYADTASGGGMSDSPTGKAYIGLAYNKTTATESSTATDYAWSLILGPGTEYRTPEPPTGLGADDEATWYDTDNGNLRHFWDGNSWEPMPLGPDATTQDVIAGKKLPLNTQLELQWGVPDPNIAPSVYPSMKPLWQSGFTISEANFCGLVRDGGSYVQLKSDKTSGSSIEYWRPMITDATTGAQTFGPYLEDLSGSVPSGAYQTTRMNSLQGLVKLGSFWYVLADPSYSSQHELLKYDLDWNLVSKQLVGPSFFWGRGYYGLATDGTNLITISDTDGMGSDLAASVIEHHNPTTWALVSSVTVGDLHGVTPTGIMPLANYDFGAARYIVFTTTGSFPATPYAEPVTSTGVVQAAERFTPAAGSFYTTGVTGAVWNATAARFEIVADSGTIHQTSPANTERSVWAAHTLYDSLADPDLHESALSPVTTSPTVVPKRCGLIYYTQIPVVDDVQAPDTIRAYARVGDATQPSKPAMDLQSGVQVSEMDGNGYVTVYVDQPVNGGAAPPTLSSFPAAPSGEVVSELGGLVLRGDGTVDSPYQDRHYDARYDFRYAKKDHDHGDLDGRISLIEDTYRPVGEVTQFYGTEAQCPLGWLVMNGQTVTDMATRYPKLYAYLGNSTVVPDMRDRGVVGASGTKALGSTGGADTHTLAEANLPAHSHGAGSLGTSNPGDHRHSIDRGEALGGSGNRVVQSNTVDRGTADSNWAGGHTHTITGSTANTGSGTAVNHQDKYRALHFMIRAA